MTFDQHIDMEFAADANGAEYAIVRIQDHHLNPTGTINGGVFLTMADNLATGAANRAYFAKTGERKFLVGVDLHAVMLSNQKGGVVRVDSEPVRVGRRITIIRSRITGEGGTLLAEVTTTHVPT